MTLVDTSRRIDVGFFNCHRDIPCSTTVFRLSSVASSGRRGAAICADYSSRLCQPDRWPADIDAMASLYDDELNLLLDECLPLRQFLRRPRLSDPWFDSECRMAKRLTRRLERSSAAASRWADQFTADTDAAAKAAAAKKDWYAQRRLYRQLRHRKSSEFWRCKLEADQSDPGKLWRSVDVLLGRGFMTFFATHSSRRLLRRPASMLPTPVRIARFPTSALCRNSWSV